jgi:hypothetical protein
MIAMFSYTGDTAGARPDSLPSSSSLNEIQDADCVNTDSKKTTENHQKKKALVTQNKLNPLTGLVSVC